jgi:hypothetical protein
MPWAIKFKISSGYISNVTFRRLRIGQVGDTPWMYPNSKAGAFMIDFFDKVGLDLLIDCSSGLSGQGGFGSMNRMLQWASEEISTSPVTNVCLSHAALGSYLPPTYPLDPLPTRTRPTPQRGYGGSRLRT